MDDIAWAIISHDAESLIIIDYVSEDIPTQAWLEYNEENKNTIILVLIDTRKERYDILLPVSNKDVEVLKKHKDILLLEVRRDGLVNEVDKKYKVNIRL